MTPIKKPAHSPAEAQPIRAVSKTETSPAASSKPAFGKKLVAAAIGGLLVISSIFWGPIIFGNQKSDALTQEQVAELTANFQTAVAEFPVADLSTPEKRKEVAVALRLPEPQAEQILQSAEQGLTRLVWITVWDNYAEDGDVVTLSSEGYTVTLPMFNTPTTAILPAPAGGRIRVTGVTDGGGGITVSVKTNAGHLPFPPLSVGQSVELPVR